MTNDGFVFEPDLDLEWEVGPDRVVVFEPDEEAEMGSAGSVFLWLLLFCALYEIVAWMRDHWHL